VAQALLPARFLLRRNPSDLGFRTTSHQVNARGRLKPAPLIPKFKIAGRMPALHKNAANVSSHL
jgi:hypothetical protein